MEQVSGISILQGAPAPSSRSTIAFMNPSPAAVTDQHLHQIEDAGPDTVTGRRCEISPHYLEVTGITCTAAALNVA